MAKAVPKHIKLFEDQSPKPTRPQIETIGSLPEVLRAFQRTTGWSLRYVAGSELGESTDLTWSAPVNPGVGTTPGHLRLDPINLDSASHNGSPVAESPVAKSPVDEKTARGLASSLADMLGEFLHTRQALWKREAELAAGVPLVPSDNRDKHLAERLEAVLRGGAEAVGCQAAALYLLDEATTQLKLRSSCGLPFDRMTASPRPLKGAVADLEALLGHAVVLEDTDAMRYWKVPEDFPAAVCVPVSTSTTILGTLWVFCDEKRDFDDRQTNIIEVVAGRIAADLEREMLMREGVDSAQLKHQVALAERLQNSQLPNISPLIDGWELSGWTSQSQAVGGDFYDWFCLPGGLLATAVGDAMDQGIEAGMSANALKAAIRAHGQYHREAEQVLYKANLTMWTGSAGDQSASMYFGLLETATGRINYSTGGDLGMVVVRSTSWDSLANPSLPLGGSPEGEFETCGYELKPGEALVIFTDGVRDACDQAGCPFDDSGVASSLIGKLHLSADELVARTREKLEEHSPATADDDRTILVIKRTAP